MLSAVCANLQRAVRPACKLSARDIPVPPDYMMKALHKSEAPPFITWGLTGYGSTPDLHVKKKLARGAVRHAGRRQPDHPPRLHQRFYNCEGGCANPGGTLSKPKQGVDRGAGAGAFLNIWLSGRANKSNEKIKHS